MTLKSWIAPSLRAPRDDEYSLHLLPGPMRDLLFTLVGERREFAFVGHRQHGLDGLALGAQHAVIRDRIVVDRVARLHAGRTQRVLQIILDGDQFACLIDVSLDA